MKGHGKSALVLRNGVSLQASVLSKVPTYASGCAELPRNRPPFARSRFSPGQSESQEIWSFADLWKNLSIKAWNVLDVL